ncbi:MAG: antibiotic biosynthesis monooxygenase family protein [Bacteroidota bacterium]
MSQIKRIVRMEFAADKVQDFLRLFDRVQSKIRRSEGCLHLELCRDANNANIYFTFSIWDSEQDLERYRASDLFAVTWKETKTFFNGKPEAFSLIEEKIPYLKKQGITKT